MVYQNTLLELLLLHGVSEYIVRTSTRNGVSDYAIKTSSTKYTAVTFSQITQILKIKKILFENADRIFEI